MTWDGRLDNREDLLLQLRRDLHDDTTDVALAMAAYEKWGVEGFARLCGDWSLAIWDASKRSVVLASDFMGVRPLYYSVTGQSLIWASSLETLVTHVGREGDFEPRFILGYLVHLYEPDLTPYRGILSLSPGHAFVQPGKGEGDKLCFWQCGLTTIRYRRQQDYAEHLREIFGRAVSSRIADAPRVWCEVSGGLDSSSIACMSHTLLSIRQASCRLTFISHITDQAPESDERSFCQAVERQCGVATRYLRLDDHPRLAPGHWLAPVIQSPIYREVAGLMKQDGARVLLSGRLGDAVMGNFPSDYGSLADLLAAGQLKRFLTLTRAWCLAAQEPIVAVLARSLGRFWPAAIRIRAEWKLHLTRQRRYSRGSTDFAHVFSLNPNFPDYTG